MVNLYLCLVAWLYQGSECSSCNIRTMLLCAQPPVHCSLSIVTPRPLSLLQNDHLDWEHFSICSDCGRSLHNICVQHMDAIWPNGFTCESCLKIKGAKRRENRYVAKRKSVRSYHSRPSQQLFDWIVCPTIAPSDSRSLYNATRLSSVSQ